MTRPIIFVDANTVWHRRLAQALAESGPAVAVNPRGGIWPNTRRGTDGPLTEVAIDLPRGWASATAFLGQRLLYRQIHREARAIGGAPLVMLTSPAYAPLARLLAGEFPIVSYTADDYRSYSGWGGAAVAVKERQIHQLADLSVFVSESLRARAVGEFALDPARTCVSPNATEHRFAQRDPGALLPELAGRPGPVVGIIGALTDRLDCAALAEVAASPKVGTFLVAGPAADDVRAQYPAFNSEKCVITGFLDHAQMHRYAQALDLALIPYARGALNHHCSPMRLYDHLATGVPILALSGCDQIDQGDWPGVEVTEPELFRCRAESLVDAGLPRPRNSRPDYFWDFRSSALRDVLEKAISQ